MKFNVLLARLRSRVTSTRVVHGVKLLLRWCGYAVSILFMMSLLFDYGYELTAQESVMIGHVYKVAWLYFAFVYLYHVIFERQQINRKSLFMTVVIGVLLGLSALPRVFAVPDSAFLGGVWSVVGSRYFTISLLTLLSVVDISRGVVNFINKKTNPALLLTVGFLSVIIMGTILLLLPRSTIIPISIVDSLFVATSAVCVTGLTPVDVSTTFTTEGQIIIALLIQIGGLGVMTLTSFFAMFFMGNTGLYNQFALRDMVGSDTFDSLFSTLLYILGFTLIIEGAGMLCIWLSVHSTMGMTLRQELFFSAFHAVSAFCNAGFSTLSGNLGNPLLLGGHNGFYVVISLLIIMGGIGFPILVNFKTILVYRLRLLWHRVFPRRGVMHKLPHLTNLNTRIVLITTFCLILFGTCAIALFEWHGSFAQMPVADKIVQSFFNAVSPRTAGFNSVDLTYFSMQSIIVYMLLMWIGGAAQSTAGGIKVNTFAVAVCNFFSVVKGADRVELFGRELSQVSVRRASATVFGSLMLITIFSFTLIALEPDIAPLGLLFEAISALGTVGSSLNVTAQLGDVSKVVVSILMFIGRVSIITVLMSLISNRDEKKYRLPKDRVIIN